MKITDAVKRPEVLVFGAIIVIIAILTLTVNVAQPGASRTETSSLPNLGAAPELAGISGWINSDPVKISDLKGKVVLVDFWTYSCINCIRTLPYLNDWYDKYHDKGLVILSVHTPEFEFEKDYDNVKSAVDAYSIKYIVAQDNDYLTWRAFKNQYWPRKYILDKEGNIRYDHIGEGGYDETEKVIQELLGTTANMTASAPPVEFQKIGTPELYLGYDFARAPLGNSEGFVKDATVNYKPINVTTANIIYLSGNWTNNADKMTAAGNSSLFLIYRAKNVYIVAAGNSSADIYIDGFRSGEGLQGTDVSGGRLIASEQRLYNILSTQDYGTHVVEIRAQPGFEIYTFTFG